MALHIEVFDIVSMVRYEDDTRVVVHAHFAKIIEPFSELEERGHVYMVVRDLLRGTHIHRSSVDGIS